MDPPTDLSNALRRRVVSSTYEDDLGSKPVTDRPQAADVPLPPIPAEQASKSSTSDSDHNARSRYLERFRTAALPISNLNLGPTITAVSSWSRNKWYGPDDTGQPSHSVPRTSLSEVVDSVPENQSLDGPYASNQREPGEDRPSIKLVGSPQEAPSLYDATAPESSSSIEPPSRYSALPRPSIFSTLRSAPLPQPSVVSSARLSYATAATAHEEPYLAPMPPAQTEDLLSASVAATALSELGASLRWSQKFPEGTHMQRAMSRSTLLPSRSSTMHDDRLSSQVSSLESTSSRASSRATNGSRRRGSMAVRSRVALAELREGLRFLAKKRLDVEGDAGSKPSDRDDLWDDQSAVGNGPDGAQQLASRTSKWTPAKWILFVSVLVIFAYGVTGLVCVLVTWGRGWAHADVSLVADPDLVIFLALATSLALVTSVVGLCGTILNSRPLLALYAFLLWPTLISMLVVGYSSYKRANLMLDRKLNMAWSRYYDDMDRLRVQNNLHCCGFYSSLHEAVFSGTCYPRTTLPGCKGKLYRFEAQALRRLYTVVFTLVFFHLGAIAASLLCSNHVNRTFGKGLTPRAYRLDMTHVRRNAVGIMKALARAQAKREQQQRRAGYTEQQEHAQHASHGDSQTSEGPWRDISLDDAVETTASGAPAATGIVPLVPVPSSEGTQASSIIYHHNSTTSAREMSDFDGLLRVPTMRPPLKHSEGDTTVTNQVSYKQGIEVHSDSDSCLRAIGTQEENGTEGVASSIRHVRSQSSVMSAAGLGLTMPVSEEDARRLKGSGLARPAAGEL